MSRIAEILKSKEFLIFFISFIVIAGSIQLRYGDPMASRIMTIRAMVEHHTLDINTVEGLKSIDKICYANACYSTKPPLLTIIGAGLYYIYYNILSLKFSVLSYFLLSLSIIGGSFSLLLVLFYRALRCFRISEYHGFLFTFSLGFGTLLFSYSTMFSNHVLSALLIFIAFYSVLKIELGANIKIYIFLAGLFSSFALATEILQGLIFLIVLFVYFLIKKETRKYIYFYILGALPAIIFYCLYNLQVTGNIFPAYLNKKLYIYPGSYWVNPVGIDALSHNKLFYLFNILFGTHGIFLYSPILVFGAWGLIKTARNKKSILYKPAWLILISLILIIVSLTLVTNNYGGASYGFRWFIICFPCLFFFNVALINNFKNKCFTIWYLITLIFSVFFAYLAFAVIWPWNKFSFLGQEIYFPLLDQLGGLFFYFEKFIHHYILY